MARIIIMITSRLHKTRQLCLQIFKCRDVIWIVMELSFMLLRRLWQLINSCYYKHKGTLLFLGGAVFCPPIKYCDILLQGLFAYFS